MKIEGKAFIVTGGCGSIGGSAARGIIAKGGIAAVFDTLPQEVGEAKVKSYHPDRAFYFRVDISDFDAVSKACDAVLDQIPKGSLFGGVHCAAVATSRKWSGKLKDSVADFQRTMNINVNGTFIVDACIGDAINSQYPDEGPFHPRYDDERGCIINIASAVANPVPARCLTYGPSKTAVNGITRGMADFLGPSAIRVCSVSPAVVASGIMGPERVPYFLAELDAAAIYPRRLSDPEEVTHGIIFLLENSMMNDFELRVDGGWRGGSNWGGQKDPRSNAPSLE